MNNNRRFQIKMYCNILGIKYEELENLSIEEQLKLIEEAGKKGIKIVEQTKQTLSDLLIKEKEKEEKVEKDIDEAIKIVNEGHNSNRGKVESR